MDISKQVIISYWITLCCFVGVLIILALYSVSRVFLKINRRTNTNTQTNIDFAGETAFLGRHSPVPSINSNECLMSMSSFGQVKYFDKTVKPNPAVNHEISSQIGKENILVGNRPCWLVTFAGIKASVC